MDNLKKTYNQIKELKIQGATDVAINILLALKNYGLGLKTKNQKLWKEKINKAAKYLLSVRVTEPMAQNGVSFVLKSIKKKKPENITEAKNVFEKAIDEFLALMAKANSHIIHYGQKIVRNNNNILTHCHSELVEQILVKAKKSGKNFKVFNTETRPLFQGHITAKELLKAKIPVTMVVDSSAGFLISRYSGKELMMDKVILGADAILSDGSAINKIGSFSIGLVSSQEKVPLYIAASLLKFHPQSWIKIEQRPPQEIWPQAPKKLKIINFAFDMIPSSYIKGIICEAGIIEPSKVKKYISYFYPFLYENR